MEAWKEIKDRDLPSRTSKEILKTLDNFASYRGISPNQIFDDLHSIDPTLLDKFKTNGQINRANLVGFSYEGHLKRKFGMDMKEFKPPDASASVTFDGKYVENGIENWVEVKYRDFFKNMTTQDDIVTWKSKFGNLKHQADLNGKPFMVITEGEVSEIFKVFFTQKGILFKSNFK